MGLEVADLFATLGLKPDHESWEKGDKLIESVKHGLEAFAGIEAVKKIGEMVDHVVEAAVGAERLGQKIGITAEAVQELGYAADVSGASTEDLQVSMQHLARGMEEFRTKGTGPMKDGLNALNLSFSQLKGESLDQNLEAIADKFAEMPDGVKKTAAAMDIFGRSGTALIPLLNKGGDGIAELRNEAEKLGVVIGGEGIKRAEEFEESQKRLKATITGLKNEAIVALLPALNEMISGLMEWVKANREVIASSIQTVVEGLMIAMRGLGYVVQAVVAVIDFFAEHAELARAVLIALGIIISGIALEAAASWAIAHVAMLEVIAAVTAAVLVFQDLFKALTQGRGVIAAVFRFIVEGLRRELHNLEDAFTAIGGFFSNVAKKIQDEFEIVIDWISGKIDWAWNQIEKLGRAPGAALSAAVDFFSGGGDGAGSGPGGSAAASVAQRVVPGSSGAPSVTVDARTTLEINASGTDPQGVVDIARDQISQHHDRVWRDVNAAVGGDEP